MVAMYKLSDDNCAQEKYTSVPAGVIQNLRVEKLAALAQPQG